MGSGEIKIGIVGAGQIARKRHLPGFAAIPGVRVHAVCNMHRESTARVAREHNIPKLYGSWENLVEDDELDAIVIGAWPYLHCPVTLAAIGARKHVLTQARMAMNAREAQRMHDAAAEHPELTTMIVPSPYGLVGDAFVRSLIDDGYLDTLREVHVTGFSSDLADPATPLGWRQISKYTGFNMLTLGILYESALRWTPPVRGVMAFASKHVPRRVEAETGANVRVGSPDSVQVLTNHEGGACGSYRLSGVLWHEDRMGISMYGSEGTLIYDLKREELVGGRRKDNGLKPIPIPQKQRGGWQVEADFIAAIRGERKVTRTDFATGVRYMQFTEAVARSSRHQHPVGLPLQEFSNPSL
jgi:predicted dehydrogenase